MRVARFVVTMPSVMMFVVTVAVVVMMVFAALFVVMMAAVFFVAMGVVVVDAVMMVMVVVFFMVVVMMLAMMVVMAAMLFMGMVLARHRFVRVCHGGDRTAESAAPRFLDVQREFADRQRRKGGTKGVDVRVGIRADVCENVNQGGENHVAGSAGGAVQMNVHDHPPRINSPRRGEEA